MDYGYNHSLSLKKETQLMGHESITVIFCDAERYIVSSNALTSSYYWNNPAFDNGVQWCHNSGANFLFYDGHVEWATEDIVSKFQSGTKNSWFDEWYFE